MLSLLLVYIAAPLIPSSLECLEYNDLRIIPSSLESRWVCPFWPSPQSLLGQLPSLSIFPTCQYSELPGRFIARTPLIHLAESNIRYSPRSSWIFWYFSPLIFVLCLRCPNGFLLFPPFDFFSFLFNGIVANSNRYKSAFYQPSGTDNPQSRRC